MKKLLIAICLFLPFAVHAQDAIIREGVAQPGTVPADTSVRILRTDRANADVKKRGLWVIRKGKTNRQIAVAPEGVQAMIDAGSIVALPVVTSISGFTNVITDRANYDGSTWVKTAGTINTGTDAAYPGIKVPGPSGFHYVRQILDAGINVKWFGADADSTTLDDAAFSKAKLYARSIINGWVQVPTLPNGQKYYLSPQTLQTGDRIIGDIGKPKIRRNNVRGPAFSWAGNKVEINNLAIYQWGTNYEGPIYFAGSDNRILNVFSYGSQTTTFVVEAFILNGAGSILKTENNLFESCHAEGQWSYHESGGKSPFMAGQLAKNTTFRFCTAKNNTPCDPFDSDRAFNTVFDRCTAIQEGTQSAHAGFWAEGSEDTTFVKRLNCYAKNFTIGFGTSEYAQATDTDCRSEYCQKAIDMPNGNSMPYMGVNHTAFKCGNGLGSDLIKGVYNLVGPATVTLINPVSDSSLAKYDASVYAGSTYVGDAIISGGRLTGIQVGYENGGLSRVYIGDYVQIKATADWYNSTAKQVKFDKAIFLGGGIIGARIGRATVTNSVFSGSGSGTAITLSLDNFNLRTDHTHFQNYTNVGANATIGLYVTTNSVTNPIISGEQGFVQGRPETRSAVVNTFNADYKAGFLIVVSPATGAPTDPGAGTTPVWYLEQSREDNGGSAEAGTVAGAYWHKQEATNLITGNKWIRIRNGSSQTWGIWGRYVTTAWFPVNITASPSDAMVLRFDGVSNVFKQDFLKAEDVATGNFAAGRLAAGTPTNGYVVKSASGVPTWAPDNDSGGGGGGGTTTDATSLTTGTLDDARLSANVTKNTTTQTLTNKTMSGGSNTFSAIPQSAVSGLVTDLSGKQPTLPTQTGNSGKVLGTDGTNVSWVTDATGGGGGGVADPGGNGVMIRTATNTTTARSVTASSGAIVVTNGNGVSGNIGIDVGTGVTQNTATQTLTNKTIDASNNTLSNIAQSSVTGLVSGLAGKQASLPSLTGNSGKFLTNDGSSVYSWLSQTSDVADPGANGILVRSSANTATPRSIAVGSSNLTVSNGDGVAGNPTVDVGTNVALLTATQTLTNKSINGSTNTLTNIPQSAVSSLGTDLAGKLADPGSNGIPVRTASGVTTPRSVSAGSGAVVVTNGNGVSGNILIDLGTGVTQNTTTQTLTNKSIDGASNTFANIPESAVTGLVSDLAGKQATLPTQTGNSGKVLGTNGSTPSWVAQTAGIDPFYTINGVILQTLSYEVTSSTQALSSGSMYAMQVVATTTGSATNVRFQITSGASGLTAGTTNNGVGVYAADGTKIGFANCNNANFTSVGEKSVALDATLNTVAGTKYFVVWVSTGTTPPTFVSRSNTNQSIMNVGISAAPYKWSVKSATTAGSTLDFTTFSSVGSTAPIGVWFSN